ncbi:MAG: oxygen-dependent coproporphyrinogen oxidase [Gammaproteobacteria bacterium]|nr:oxygen-dependent coproporphyrinogen oxidase [Gammaproteobacteria bacterium]
MNEDINSQAVKQFLTQFHSDLCAQLSQLDGKADFGNDTWTRAEGGGGNTRTLADGDLFEKGGVAFSHIHGDKLPPSASAARPELAGRKYQAMGVSLVLHTQNPHVPCTHMNVRFFFAEKPGEHTIWWFGGGFDLTPYYGYEEDCRHWHTMAKQACDPFGPELYARFKANCDDYFYLPHRNETRGVGGLFFDDYNGDGFEHAFGLTQSVATHFYKAYAPIVQRRRSQHYTAEQKQFQCYRRGRYTEFNLLHDRGTLFGLQSGGRTESILMSLPPTAHWWYQPTFNPGTPEYELTEKFLRPNPWL